MHIFQQQTQVFQNSNGHVRKAFKIVKGNDSKVMEVKGITNKENPSIYHILKTLKKNNMAIHQYYKINENDIMRLLKEGNQEDSFESLKKEEKKKAVKTSVKKEEGQHVKKKIKKEKMKKKKVEGEQIKKKIEKGQRVKKILKKKLVIGSVKKEGKTKK